MLKTGLLNPAVLHLLARIRHTNTLVTGATVAVMDVSEPHLAFCRQLGVKHTVIAGPEAPAQLKVIGNGDLPTIVIDTTGNPAVLKAMIEV